MDKLKENWFLMVNVSIFLATLIIFFMYVVGATGREGDMVDKLDRSRRVVTSLAREKPTPAWFELLDDNVAAVSDEKKILSNLLKDRDELLDVFYSLEDRSQATKSIPSTRRYPEFKELMQAKWSALIARYCSQGSPYSCASSVLTVLEPSWLRSVHTPASELQVRESMKRYWISTEILKILSAHGTQGLSTFELGKNVSHEQYKKGDQLFWGVRDIKLVARIKAEKFSELLRAFHESDFKFRVLSFDLKNVIDSVPGVTSDVTFVSFRDPETHDIVLNLSHYDLVQEGEVLSFGGEGAAPNAGIQNAGRRRRR
jgi:hypothetical protein